MPARTAALCLATSLAAGVGAFAPAPHMLSSQVGGRGNVQPALCGLRGTAEGAGETLAAARRRMVGGALAGLVVTGFSGKASAKKPKLAPCKLPVCVQATGPGVALDMIILMKAARAMREAGEKLEAGDFKPMDKWCTDSFSSTSFAFVKKTKVLESLATSLLGVSVADDFDADPSFSSEESVDSKQAAAMAQDFYGKVAVVQDAMKGKDQEGAVAAFGEAVEALDELLAAYKMPDVANASPDAVRTPK